MVYKSREKLFIIETNKEQETYNVQDLLSKLTRPSYDVYFECNGKAYARVDMYSVKDCINSGKEEVNIWPIHNYLDKPNYIKSREFLLNNKTEREIPLIIDDKIIGAYRRSSSLGEIKRIYEFYDLKEPDKVKTVCILRLDYEEKDFDFFVEYLTKRKYIVCVKDYHDYIAKPENYDFVLLESEFDIMCYEDLSFILNYDFSYVRHYSLLSFLLKYNEDDDAVVARDFLSDYFIELESKGVKVFNVYFENFEYIDNFDREIAENYKAHGLTVSEKEVCDEQAFFAENYSPEYADAILRRELNVKSKSGINIIEDTTSKYFNVKDGIRKTTNQNPNPESNIHMFGPCITLGFYVEDKFTIESQLQKKLNENNINMNVINHGVWNNNIAHIELINNTDLYTGDTIVFFQMYDKIKKICNINVGYHYYYNYLDINWFVNNSYHFNHIVNRLYAEDIFKNIEPSLYYKPLERRKIEKNDSLVNKVYLKKSFSRINLDKYKNIGSIVMNANPFTLGHRYLIDEALKKCDFLIIFVLSEDASLFTFNERFRMVQDGVKDLKNVYVVPTSYNILSKKTFPEYFIKVVDEDIEFNIENDVDIFVKEIASKLNIKYRFVGSEPTDPVTSKYNEIMKKKLPKAGIELIEIKRKEKNKNIVSGTLVRDLLKEGNLEEVKKFVPESTYDAIVDKDIKE